jgi:cellulose synthase/poly-beta-1,6-N-acetylglucosamine synthase-like glycosyltransferase
LTDFELGTAFLLSQSMSSLLAMFWFVVVFDLPRYILPFAALALTQGNRGRFGDPDRPAARKRIAPSSISVVIIGYNEAGSIAACVRSLRQQSISGFEIIIVSDGSSDRMSRVAADLVKRGEADRIVATDKRGGKASGTNLAMKLASGDIIVNVDCDCSFDRFAIEELVAPLANPRVAAVSGDIAPRNTGQSLITQIQTIEYLQSISVGKRFSNLIHQVTCASGAFSAFRRSALDEVGGFDVGGGEDLDTTMRLRQAGWQIAYAPAAVCYTDVPEAPYAYLRQRLRWERDAIWIRFRKHRHLLNPFDPRFRPLEALHQWDFLIFNVFAVFVFPVYLCWLVAVYGASAIPVLLALQIALLVLDVTMLALASRVSGRSCFWRNLPFLPAYSVFMTYVMRPVRAFAYVQEWFVFASRGDNYVPPKVRRARAW